MEPVSFTSLASPRLALLRQARASVRVYDIQKDSFVDQYSAIRATLAKLRGERPAANNKLVPKATVGDVVDLAASWTQAAKRFGKKPGDADKSTHKRWLAYVEKSIKPALKLGRAATFPPKENERFWREASRVAIWLNSLSVIVPPWRMAFESTKEAAGEAPAKAGDALVSLGESIGEAAGAPFKGLASAFGVTPRNILFGFALVGASYALLRKAKR